MAGGGGGSGGSGLEGDEEWPCSWEQARDAVRRDPKNREIAMLAAAKYPNVLLCGAPSLKKDRDVVLKAVSKNGEALAFVDDALRGDREIVMRAVAGRGVALRQAATSMSEDRDIVVLAVAQDEAALKYVGGELKDDCSVRKDAKALRGSLEAVRLEPWNRNLVLAVVSGGLRSTLKPGEAQLQKPDVQARHSLALCLASEELRGDKEVVLRAVSFHGEALAFASPELKADPQVVRLALSWDGAFILHAADSVKAAPEMVLVAVAQNGKALVHVSNEMQATRDVVVLAACENEQVLDVAAAHLVNDPTLYEEMALLRGCLEHVRDAPDIKDVVLREVATHGLALSAASDAMRLDREVVLQAVGSCASALAFAAYGHWSDREVMMRAVDQSGDALYFGRFQGWERDPELVFHTVLQNGLSLRFVADELRAYHPVVLLACAQTDGAMQFVAEAYEDMETLQDEVSFLRTCIAEIQRDPDSELTVQRAVSKAGMALAWADKRWQSNRSVAIKAVEQYGNALCWVSMDLRGERELVSHAVANCGKALCFAAPHLQADHEVVLIALGQDGCALRYASEELRADRDVVLRALAKDGHALAFASEDLQEQRDLVALALAQNPDAVMWVPHLSDDMALQFAAEKLSGHRPKISDGALSQTSELHATARFAASLG